MALPGNPRFCWSLQTLCYVAAGCGLAVGGALLHAHTLVAFGGMLLLWVATEALLVVGRLPDLEVAVNPGRLAEGQQADVQVKLAGGPKGQQIQILLDPTLELTAGSNLLEGKPGQGAHGFHVTATARGPRRVGPALVRWWSPSGLWTREFTLGQACSLEVIPRREDVRRFGVLSKAVKPREGRFTVNRPGQGFDFFTLRNYASGDTMRNVNWKASARHEDLIVNQRQRETMTDLTLLVDSRLVSGVGPRGSTPLDRACRVALSLFEQGIRSRDLTRLVTYGERVAKLGFGPDRVVACEAVLASVQAEGTLGLLEAWQDVRGDIHSPGPVVILSSLEGDTQAANAVADMIGRHHPVTVFSPAPIGPTWDAVGSQGRRSARTELLQSLLGLGATVVDWTPGAAVEAQPANLVGVPR